MAIKLPTNCNMRNGYSYNRFTSDATMNPLPSGTLLGDMVMSVVLTPATVTIPSAWRLLYSHTFNDTTYYIVVMDSAPAAYGTYATWGLDWTGVTVGTDWVWVGFRFGRTAGDEISGLTWDYKVTNNDNSLTGTWTTVSDPTWLYSVPLLVQEHSHYLYNTYGINSYTHNAFDNWYQDSWNANGIIFSANPQSVSPTVPSTWAPGATDGGKIWTPDQFYSSSYDGFGTASNATVRLGVKPLASPSIGAWGQVRLNAV